MSQSNHLATVIFAALLVTSCGTFRKLKEEVDVLENDLRLVGVVTNMRGDPSKVHVAVWKTGQGDVEIVDHATPDVTGHFALFLKPGSEYYAAAFEDSNGSDRWEQGEPVWFHGDPNPSAVPLQAGRVSKQLKVTLSNLLPVDENLAMGLRAARGSRKLVELGSGEQVKIAIGEIADLDAPEFSAEMERQGLWEPATFLKQRGIGIYFMGPYDPGKRPLLLINGCGGSPQTWRPLIANLDRSKYQPWIYMAPSGWRLEQSARGVNEMVKLLHKRHQFERMDVVAYSMGGLTARRFIQMNKLEDKQGYIKKFVTVSTPWSGHEMAEMGVERAPTAIPAWLDIRTESEFIQGIYEDRLPVKHYLIYTTKGKRSPLLPKNNDGTVSIVSQLDPRAKSDAADVKGYELTHVTGVASAEVARQVQEYLAD